MAATRDAMERAISNLREISDITSDGTFQLFAVLSDSLQQGGTALVGRQDRTSKMEAGAAKAA